MKEMSFITVYCTYPNIQEAKELSNILLDKHLIACANFFPIESIYHWKGQKESTQEIVTLYKTQHEHREIIQKEILQRHSYKTPCIIKFDIEANPTYEQRIINETS